MRVSCILPVSAILLALLGCGQKKAPQALPVTTTQTKGAPAWIDHEEIPDGLAAVGIAGSNLMGDKQLQRTEAQANGRTALAAKIQVRVQGMFSQLTQRMNTAASGEKKPAKAEVMQRVQENVTRQVVNETLSGSVPREFWVDPADGSLYVFMVMSKDTVDKTLANTAQAQLHKEIAQGEKSLEDALDKLDAAIAASAN
jgi:hypothetical protein